MAAATLLLKGGAFCWGLRLPAFSAAVYRSRLFHAAACPPGEGGVPTLITTAELDSSNSSGKMGPLMASLLENKTYRDRETAILKDIEPIRNLAKEILHSERHPQFRNSRCLFVVRTDGVYIDFSYQKCLREYIRMKYPSSAERFIRENFKRT